MLTQSLLSFISILDSHGAQTWNLRLVAATSALVLYLTYRIGRSGPGGKKLGNVCWEGFLHAALSGGHEPVADVLVAAAPSRAACLLETDDGQTAVDLARSNDFGGISRRIGKAIDGLADDAS